MFFEQITTDMRERFLQLFIWRKEKLNFFHFCIETTRRNEKDRMCIVHYCYFQRCCCCPCCSYHCELCACHSIAVCACWLCNMILQFKMHLANQQVRGAHAWYVCSMVFAFINCVSHCMHVLTIHTPITMSIFTSPSIFVKHIIQRQ